MLELHSRSKELTILLKELPTDPGVYKFIGKDKVPLYIGKAKNIKKRVSSYFKGNNRSKKILNLAKESSFLELTITSNELEALLLEQNLIKTIRPKFNIQFKDDKGYPWIKIERSKEFPSANSFLGKKDKKEKYFGPYPSAYALRDCLSLIQKTFKLRNCSDSFFRNRTRPCMQYQIGRCSAPCVGLIQKKDYLKDVEDAQILLEGNSEELIEGFYSLMDDHSKSKSYERAAVYRDKISALRDIQRTQSITGFKKERDALSLQTLNGLTKIGITHVNNDWITGHENFSLKISSIEESAIEAFIKRHYLSQSNCPRTLVVEGNILDKKVIEIALSKHHSKSIKILTKLGKKDKGLLEITKSNTIHALKRSSRGSRDISHLFGSLMELLNFKGDMKIIESYDVSHHASSGAVCGCVVYSKKGKLKDRYRLYNITKNNSGNDIASMKEVIERRFKKKDIVLPDLILVDGGATHLKAVKDSLQKLNIESLRVISISKGARRKSEMDSIHLTNKNSIRIQKGSLSHLFLQEIRDETHRYAIRNQQNKQVKLSLKSSLLDLPDVGEKRKIALLRYFGSLEQIKRASKEDIIKIQGIGSKTAQKIYQFLK